MITIKRVFLVLIIVCIGFQFIPIHTNNVQIIENQTFDSLYETPKNIIRLLENGCYDCHSNQTNYPWYSKVQPFSFFMSKHVNDGKRELNFSEFVKYTERRRQSKLRSIINQLEENEMPPFEYKVFHSDAYFSESEKKKLIRWFRKLID